MKLPDVNIWLAAFALCSGFQIVTTDKAFSRFKGAGTPGSESEKVMNPTPKTIQIFLPGGDPQGIRVESLFPSSPPGLR